MNIFLRLFAIIFIASAIIGIIYTFLSLIFANIYDVKQLKKLARQAKRPHGKWRTYRPLVTIIIAAHNEEMLIERCIRSILRSSYRKYKIIVVNDASTDDTVAIVTKLIADYPQKDIKLINKRLNEGKGTAIQTALKRYARSELVMTLDADCVIERNAIKNATQYFIEPTTVATASNVRILPTYSLLGLLQRFEYLIGYRSKKFYSIANCEYIIGGVGAVYRRPVLLKASKNLLNMQTEDIATSMAIAGMGNRHRHMIYASNVVIYTEPVLSYLSLFRQRYRWKLGALQAIYKHRQIVFNLDRSYSKTLSLFRLPIVLWSETLLLFEPMFFLFFTYLAIINLNPAYYLGASFILAIIVLISIWSDEHFSLSEKSQLSLLAPAMYPLFVLMSSVQVLAAIRCLLNYSAITGKVTMTGKWVSPKRLATTVSTTNK